MPIIPSQWETKTLNYRQITLDPENPRLPLRYRGSEDMAFKFLAEKEKIIDLANSIIKAGALYTHESIICLKCEGDEAPEYVVLEGNRRLSAIRIIQDPSILDVFGIDSGLLLNISKELRNSTKLLKAEIVVTRLVATPIIAAIHLGENRHQWSDRRKVSFACMQNGHGTSYTEIAEYLLCSEDEALTYISQGKILDTLDGLEWTDEEYDLLVNDKLRLKAMFRVFLSTSAHKYFGQPIFMCDGELNEQLLDALRIVKLIVEDSLWWQVRDEYLHKIEDKTKLADYFKIRFPKADEREHPLQLFSELEAGIRVPNYVGDADVSNVLNVERQNQPYSEASDGAAWNKHADFKFFSKLNYSGTNERMAQLVRELSRLSSRSYENGNRGFCIFSLSASFLMRASLEWCLYLRIKGHGHLSDFEEKYKNRDRFSLDDILAYSVESRKNIGISPDLAQKIELIRANKSIKNDLNWNIHNNKGNSSPARLEEIANTIYPILSNLL